MDADSPPPPSTRSPRGTVLHAVHDPEWLPFLVTWLVPVCFCVVRGDWLRAQYFAAAAIYVACLKWLGWLALGRERGPLAYLRTPLELFAGLAVVCAWFYLRNHLARLAPGLYSLNELAVVFPLLLIVHVVGLAWLRPSPWMSLGDLGRRLSLHAPFAGAVCMALWFVSDTLGLMTTDSITYTYHARACLERGLDAPVPPFDRPIPYTSGFAAMNATAAALAPWHVVQAFHFQHVFLLIAALFAITTTLALRVGRPLPLLHHLVLPFLTLFPLYSLFPDVLHSGVPKQACPALGAAVCLLPLAIPATSRLGFVGLAALQGMLTALAVALNPACLPYAALAWLIGAGLLSCGDGPRRFVERAVPFCTAGVIATGLGVFVLTADPWYRGNFLASHRPVAGTSITVPASPFQLTHGLAALSGVNPLRLSPPISMVAPVPDNFNLKDWPSKPVQTLFTGAALLLGLAMLVGRWRGKGAGWGLPVVAGTALGLFFLLKYAITFLVYGLNRTSWLMQLLSVYIQYLLLRHELLLLFTATAAGAVVLVGARSADRLRMALATLMGAACWALPLSYFFSPLIVSGWLAVPTNTRFPAPPEALALARWVDANLGAEDAVIALAAGTFGVGTVDEEKHLYAYASGPAFALHSRSARCRFLTSALESESVWHEYARRIGEQLDVAWCRAEGIRYFYADERGLVHNPGLQRAIESGELRIVHREGEAALYELVPGDGRRP